MWPSSCIFKDIALLLWLLSVFLFLALGDCNHRMTLNFFPASALQVLGLQMCTTTSSLHSDGDQIQDLVDARQVLSQLSHSHTALLFYLTIFILLKIDGFHTLYSDQGFLSPNSFKTLPTFSPVQTQTLSASCQKTNRLSVFSFKRSSPNSLHCARTGNPPASASTSVGLEGVPVNLKLFSILDILKEVSLLSFKKQKYF